MRQQAVHAPDAGRSPCSWLAPTGDDGRENPAKEPYPDREPLLAGRNIMLVEDETIVAMDIQFAIEDEGGTVLGPFAGLGEAQVFVRNFEGQIDAAILDVNLRGEMVFPLATTLEQRGVPFLFHTANITLPELKTQFASYPVCNKPAKAEFLINDVVAIIG